MEKLVITGVKEWVAYLIIALVITHCLYANDVFFGL
ncbi:MAG: hypothetical protein CENE_02909 [Candidatus Celerinatantimonas neptuna]|nr:MAG: hypothetical protein CENE_02909 [Candidatus Celerinatantimonas neptuna]